MEEQRKRVKERVFE